MYLTVTEYLDRSYEGETERLASPNEILDGWDTGDEAILMVCIGDASEMVDSYLRGRYQVPIAVIPELIKRLTFQLSKYFLFEKKSMLEETAFLNYDRAISELKRIQKGETLLDAPVLSAEKSQGQITYTKGSRRSKRRRRRRKKPTLGYKERKIK